jgi:hypothetical protein
LFDRVGGDYQFQGVQFFIGAGWQGKKVFKNLQSAGAGGYGSGAVPEYAHAEAGVEVSQRQVEILAALVAHGDPEIDTLAAKRQNSLVAFQGFPRAVFLEKHTQLHRLAGQLCFRIVQFMHPAPVCQVIQNFEQVGQGHFVGPHHTVYERFFAGGVQGEVAVGVPDFDDAAFGFVAEQNGGFVAFVERFLHQFGGFGFFAIHDKGRKGHGKRFGPIGFEWMEFRRARLQVTFCDADVGEGNRAQDVALCRIAEHFQADRLAHIGGKPLGGAQSDAPVALFRIGENFITFAPAGGHWFAQKTGSRIEPADGLGLRVLVAGDHPDGRAGLGKCFAVVQGAAKGFQGFEERPGKDAAFFVAFPGYFGFVAGGIQDMARVGHGQDACFGEALFIGAV